MLIGVDASRAARSQHTGTETYSLALVQQFARLATAEQRVRLYTATPPATAAWPQSPFVTTCPIPWPRLWTHLRLATALYQQQPDVIFIPAHVMPLICAVPAVVTVHDLGYLHYPAAHGRFSRWYLDWTTRRHARLAAHLIADSEATRHDLIRYYGAHPARISVVPLGRDETLHPAPADEIAAVRARYHISGDYILYLGTLQPRKNLRRLIQAFRQVTDALHRPTLKLVIAGRRGWLYDEIFAQLQQLALTEQVIFTDYLPEEDKAALLTGAMVYAFPSLYEGFGLPVLEAMACGTPVLTSNSSSLPEVAGRAALLVNPLHVSEIATGLIALLTNSALRATLIERGYQQIEQFSWAAAAQQIWEILTEVAPHAPG